MHPSQTWRATASVQLGYNNAETESSSVSILPGVDRIVSSRAERTSSCCSNVSDSYDSALSSDVSLDNSEYGGHTPRGPSGSHEIEEMAKTCEWPAFTVCINGLKIDGKDGLSEEAQQDVRSLVDFMKANLKEMRLQAQCVVRLGWLAMDPDNRVLIFRAGGIEAIFKALASHADVILREFGVWALTNISLERRLALMVASADGIMIVCQTMQSLSKVKSFQELAARFFLVLMNINHPALWKTMKKRKVPELLKGAYEAFPNSALIKDALDLIPILEGRKSLVGVEQRTGKEEFLPEYTQCSSHCSKSLLFTYDPVTYDRIAMPGVTLGSNLPSVSLSPNKKNRNTSTAYQKEPFAFH